MESSDITAEIRVAVLGDWLHPRLAGVLALQRAKEPETIVTMMDSAASQSVRSPDDAIDFALCNTDRSWPGWVSEPLWHDTLAVGVAKRSHLLAYSHVPCSEALKQPLIWARSTADEPWRAEAEHLLGDVPQVRGQTVGTFDMTMTLVAAGYGVTIAPYARLAGYVQRGIVMRPLAGAPAIATVFLMRPQTLSSDHATRFLRRARSMR